MPVKADTKKRFNRRVDRYLNLNKAVTEKEIKRQKKILVDSRDQVISNLSTVNPTEWQMQFLPQLKTRLNMMITNLDNQLVQSANGAQEEMFEVTVANSDELNISAGIDVGTVPGFIDPDIVSATQTLTGELIKTVPQRLVGRVGNAVALGLAQDKSVNEILQDIRDIYKQTEFNAERIVRTEMLRTQSVAQEKRFQQIVETQPDLLKTWKWSHLPDGRSGHAEAELIYSADPIPFKEAFMVAPISGGHKEPMQYPRDPRGSGSNTINCACIHLLLPPNSKLTEGVLRIYFENLDFLK